MSVDPSQFHGVVCSLDEWRRSNESDLIHCLTRGETIGLTLNAVASFISLLSVLIIFLLILRNIVFVSPSGGPLIKVPMDIYMLCLFACNFVQSIGTSVDVKWIHDGKLEVGDACTAQGAMQQLGETGVAMTSLAIAMHTFATIWWRRSGSLLSAYIVVTLIWLYILTYVIVGVVKQSNNGDYETPTPVWCWIGRRYLTERITGEYMWFWITLTVSFATYLLLFFWSRGNITIKDDRWFSFEVHHASESHRKHRESWKRQSLGMLAYSIAYCFIVLPLSIVRWMAFAREAQGNKTDVSYQSTLAVDFIYDLSGAVDVILFLYARPGLLLFGARPRTNRQGRAPSPTPSTKLRLREAGGEYSATELEPGSGYTSELPTMVGALPSESPTGWDIPRYDYYRDNGPSVP